MCVLLVEWGPTLTFFLQKELGKSGNLTISTTGHRALDSHPATSNMQSSTMSIRTGVLEAHHNRLKNSKNTPNQEPVVGIIRTDFSPGNRLPLSRLMPGLRS